MTARSREALVADVGGTTARFAIADIDELTIDHFASFSSRMFPRLEDAIESYLASVPTRPKMASLAIAAPLRGPTIEFTNLDWRFTRDDIARSTGVENVLLINDFEAVAHALPHLVPHDLHQIGGGTPAAIGPRVALGPGTGLGVAGLVARQDGWTPVASEGGHIAFAPGNDEDYEIMRRMGDGDRVSAERMISGPGLERVYGVLRQMRGQPADGKSVAEVVRLAMEEADPIAEAALAHFVRWLGAFAGDMALVFGATGGVYIGGGVAPHIIKALETGAFREAFEAKGRLSGFLRPIPIHVIVAADAGLKGAAAAL
jgi:glucokinase